MTREAQIVIDTDPGVDDAIAILMALASSCMDVLGLTVVGGNVSLARGTRNALALLQAVGRDDVPVFRGRARPLRGRFGYSHAFHGNSGLSRRLPNPRHQPSPEGASEFLARKLEQNPGQVSLVALGPLSNLATLPETGSSSGDSPLAGARSITIMGGAVNTRGNVTPNSEFNFHSDPAAAARVVESGIPLTLVDLAACRQVALSREQVSRLRAGGFYGRLALEILNGWFRRDAGRASFEFYDPMALALAMEPGLATTRRLSIEVECDDSERWGESRVLGELGNVSVAQQIDRKGFFAFLAETLDWQGLDPAG